MFVFSQRDIFFKMGLRIYHGWVKWLGFTILGVVSLTCFQMFFVFTQPFWWGKSMANETLVKQSSWIKPPDWHRIFVSVVGRHPISAGAARTGGAVHSWVGAKCCLERRWKGFFVGGVSKYPRAAWGMMRNDLELGVAQISFDVSVLIVATNEHRLKHGGSELYFVDHWSCQMWA